MTGALRARDLDLPAVMGYDDTTKAHARRYALRPALTARMTLPDLQGPARYTARATRKLKSPGAAAAHKARAHRLLKSVAKIPKQQRPSGH